MDNNEIIIKICTSLININAKLERLEEEINNKINESETRVALRVNEAKEELKSEIKNINLKIVIS